MPGEYGGTRDSPPSSTANRVSFTSSTGGTTEFVYDTTAGIPAVLEEWDGEASVYYIREPGGELIARMAGANKQYYHFDELGSTRLLTDKDGVVTGNGDRHSISSRFRGGRSR